MLNYSYKVIRRKEACETAVAERKRQKPVLLKSVVKLSVTWS